MASDGFPYALHRDGEFDTVLQGTMPDEPHDPLKAAIWQALLPFREELLSTGGVTFMGLRNAVAEAVRPFTTNSSGRPESTTLPKR